MSPFGLVIMRLVNEVPGPVVRVATRFAPTNKSLAFVAVTVDCAVCGTLAVPCTYAIVVCARRSGDPMPITPSATKHAWIKNERALSNTSIPEKCISLLREAHETQRWRFCQGVEVCGYR